MERIRGLRDLVHDAVEETTSLVERTHESVAAKYVGLLREIPPIAPVVEVVDGVRRVAAAGVFEAIRSVNQGVRRLGDLGQDAVAAHPGATSTDGMEANRAVPLPRLVESAQGALNGVIGDYLRERGNGLEIPMTLRRGDRALTLDRASLTAALPATTGKICVFVHGLGCTEWAWTIGADRFWGDPTATFGTLLERERGYTALYVRYNTGLHVSENGRALSALLDGLVAAFPRDVEEIVFVGHSMGGLVCRSAAHYGAEASAAWVSRLRHVFCLGSPHLGAPLEQATHVLAAVLRAFDTPGTQIPAEILETRSAGVKDMRYGYVLDEDWRDADPDALLEDNRKDAPFVDGVAYYFVASTLTRDPEDPVGGLVGDLLSRPASASGRAREPARRIPFRIGRVFGGMNHFHLANHPDVYAQIKEWIEAAR